MAPIAAGYMVLIVAAAGWGIIIGAISGAIVWRLRINALLGGLITAVAFVLFLMAEHPGDTTWLPSKLLLGMPSLLFGFLVSSLSAQWLGTHVHVRPLWTALASFGLTLVVGFSFLMLFRVGPMVLLRAELIADLCLTFLLLMQRGALRRYTRLSKQ